MRKEAVTAVTRLNIVADGSYLPPSGCWGPSLLPSGRRKPLYGPASSRYQQLARFSILVSCLRADQAAFRIKKTVESLEE
jgi:hypothetical protein